MTPRDVVLTLADARGLTVLEVARACSLAGVRRGDITGLLRQLGDASGAPEELERAVTLLYAMAFELKLRDEPVTWDEAQHWRVSLDLETTDELAEAEAVARVDAALVTGLPPSVAGELTVRELDEYRERARVATGRGG